VVKGVNFEGLRDMGDPLFFAKRYEEEGADELVFLDISATNEGRKTAVELAKNLSQILSIPFTIGGGITSKEDAEAVLQAGADKVAVNSAAVKNPELITTLSNAFGSQAVVLAIDAKWTGEDWYIATHGGKNITNIRVLDWVQMGEKRGAGEILLTSMDKDGTKEGFDIALLQAVEKICHLPIIASGGASTPEDFLEVFSKTNATGSLAASIFHENTVTIASIKKMLALKNIPIRF